MKRYIIFWEMKAVYQVEETNGLKFSFKLCEYSDHSMVKNINYLYSKTKHLLIQLCSECKMNLLGKLCYWGSC